MDYSKKITTHRASNIIHNIDDSVESDRGRIISAPSLRRLQKRTQVFPLEFNAAVRSRLTHSLEVQQTSRYIAKQILSAINNEVGGLETFGLNTYENAFVSIVEMASLLHDIGNPPFGHFGETVMSEWLKEELPSIFDSACENMPVALDGLRAMLLTDLQTVEGNAQAIRIVHKLQQLNLSYSQVASILKYTRGAYEPSADSTSDFSYLQRKPGYYFSEESFIKDIRQHLEIEPGKRYPLTYIMEAADDICYLTADLEDAVDKDLFNFEDLYQSIMDESLRLNIENNTSHTMLTTLVNNKYEAVKSENEDTRFDFFWTHVRVELIHEFVKQAKKVYLENHEAIFHGTFNHALLNYEYDGEHAHAINVLRNVSERCIYADDRVQLAHYEHEFIIRSLLESYKPLLLLHEDEISHPHLISNPDVQALLSHLPSKYIKVYVNSVASLANVADKHEYRLMETYYRVRLFIDYFCSMTDDFLVHQHKILIQLNSLDAA